MRTLRLRLAPSRRVNLNSGSGSEPVGRPGNRALVFRRNSKAGHCSGRGAAKSQGLPLRGAALTASPPRGTCTACALLRPVGWSAAAGSFGFRSQGRQDCAV